MTDDGTTKVGIGARAPDFSLGGTDGATQVHSTYELGAYAGVPVVLVFYPADGSPVCTEQLTAYTAGLSRFEELGAQVLAISPQSVEEHDEFALAQGGFGFPLLADLDKEVGRRYSTLGPLGFYRRSVFIIDANGIVTYAHRSVAGLNFRSTDELIDAIAESG